ncbi:hypothetical protein [Luteibacter sp. SG786]|uniref:hypothetical protein n=1 Tax=Luteibacter sp. SG786 TaxID=2587130 RepID=UPI00141E29C8|nr:hypothetical protein [Luteibacter sp. SG786]NII53558.1 hypothetical protein [Luteibacter sp. SG786]
MSLIFSIAVLAFVAYDFVLLSRMRKAVNAALEATSELEDLLRVRPTKAGEIVVDLKIDAAQASEILRDLTERIRLDQEASSQEKPDSPRPGQPPSAH